MTERANGLRRLTPGSQRYELLVPKTLMAALRREAKRLGLSVSGYVRQALTVQVRAAARGRRAAP